MHKTLKEILLKFKTGANRGYDAVISTSHLTLSGPCSSQISTLTITRRGGVLAEQVRFYI